VVCEAEAKETRHGSKNGEDADAEVWEDGELVNGVGGVLLIWEGLQAGFSGSGLFDGEDGRDAGGNAFGAEAAAGGPGKGVFNGVGDVTNDELGREQWLAQGEALIVRWSHTREGSDLHPAPMLAITGMLFVLQ